MLARVAEVAALVGVEPAEAQVSFAAAVAASALVAARGPIGARLETRIAELEAELLAVRAAKASASTRGEVDAGDAAIVHIAASVRARLRVAARRRIGGRVGRRVRRVEPTVDGGTAVERQVVVEVRPSARGDESEASEREKSPAGAEHE